MEGVPPAPLTLHLVDTEGQLHHRKHLDSNFSHIFDTESQIFIWNGRGSPPEVKLEMMERAKQFLRDTGRPDTIPITVCPMGVEPALFRTHFLGRSLSALRSDTLLGSFTEYIDTQEAFEGRVKKMHKTAGTLRQEKVNVDALLHPEKYSSFKLKAVDTCLRYAIAREEFAETIPHAQQEGEVVLHKEFKVFYVQKKQLHDLPLEEYGIHPQSILN